MTLLDSGMRFVERSWTTPAQGQTEVSSDAECWTGKDSTIVQSSHCHPNSGLQRLNGPDQRCQHESYPFWLWSTKSQGHSIGLRKAIEDHQEGWHHEDEGDAKIYKEAGCQNAGQRRNSIVDETLQKTKQYVYEAG